MTMPEPMTPSARDVELATRTVQSWNEETLALEDHLAQALAVARREGAERFRERAALIAEHPYRDAVEAYGSDEPQEVGDKIAAAIRALPEREESDDA